MIAQQAAVSPTVVGRKLQSLLRLDEPAIQAMTADRVAVDDPGMAAEVLSAGCASGRLAAMGLMPREFAEDGSDVAAGLVLVSPRLSASLLGDCEGVSAIVTEREDPSSHAVIIARSRGIPVLRVDAESMLRLRSRHGDLVTVDGTWGRILDGIHPILAVDQDQDVSDLVLYAAKAAPLAVYANADQPGEVGAGRSLHARGFEPRLEHALVARDALPKLRAALFAAPELRRPHLEALQVAIEDVVRETYTAARGLPVFMRLLDPPSHEFAPRTEEELDHLAAVIGATIEDVRPRTASAREDNPMVGFRGARLLLADPDLCTAQLRAIRAAAHETGAAPHVTIPMVTSELEVLRLRALIADVFGDELVRVGAMIETPRAALIADRIAPHVDYMSFGTNDLSAMTFGLSRGDAYERFLQDYLEEGIYEVDPFAQLDAAVMELIRICVTRARSTAPNMLFTICGEQAGDPRTIDLALELGLDAVAVPIAGIARSTLIAYRRWAIPGQTEDR